MIRYYEPRGGRSPQARLPDAAPAGGGCSAESRVIAS